MYDVPTMRYLDPVEGPTFTISKERPLLMIEINERVIAGIEKHPENLARVRRAVGEVLERFFAEHVSWIGGVVEIGHDEDGKTIIVKDTPTHS